MLPVWTAPEVDFGGGGARFHRVVMMERYAQLKPELFTQKDMAAIDLDLAAGDAAVPVPLGQSLGGTPAFLGSK
jgi:hypothetical protein